MQLPETLLPELRARWACYVGVMEALSAVQALQRERERHYKDLLDTVLKLHGLDAGKNWQVNLETGEVRESVEQGGNGTTVPAAVSG